MADAEPFSKYAESRNEVKKNETWIDQLLKNQKNPNLQEEIKLYLSEPVISREADPLVYWNGKRDHFPSLFVMALQYLSVCATSAPSERAFSGGRHICCYTRWSLSAEKLTAIMCLKSWLNKGSEYKTESILIPLDFYFLTLTLTWYTILEYCVSSWLGYRY